MNNISLALLIIISLFTFSCSTDFEVNGNYGDIPIVYCVLDQSADYQYVKVNKSFIGPMSASEMAQISDSLFYENVDVQLKEYSNNFSTLVRTISFVAVDTIEKPAGYFANDKNTIFISDAHLNSDYDYELVVNINNGEHIVTGRTSLIYGTSIITPSDLQPQLEICNYTGPIPYKYYRGSNTKVSQMTLVFNYVEIIDGDTADKTISILWPQSVEVAQTSVSDEFEGEASVLAFYNLLIENIPVATSNVKRLVKMPNSIEFRLATADENFRTYMEVTSPSQGIVQEKPSFTNLTDGYGLLASRFNIILSKPLGSRTLDSISRGIYTKDLGFANRYDPYYTPWVN